MIKKHIAFIFFLFTWIGVLKAQNVGSGTITFVADTDFFIDATITDLFDGGYNVYDVSGYTNEPICLNAITVEGTSPNYIVSWEGGYGIVGGNREVYIDDVETNYLIIEVETLEAPYFNIIGNLTNAVDGVAEFRTNYFTIKSVEILNGNFSISNINSYTNLIDNNPTNIPIVFDEDNNVTDVIGQVRIKHGTYQTQTISVNLTSNNGGENIYDLGDIEVLLSNYGNDNETASVGILPRIYNEDLDFWPEIDSTTIVLTNTHFPDSTYTITTPTIDYGNMAVFWNIYVPESNNPSEYKIKINDTRADSTFAETVIYRNIYQDNDGDINGVKYVYLNMYNPPNFQNITMKVRDFETMEALPGATVDMFEAKVSYTDNSSEINGQSYYSFINRPLDKLIETQITDSEGKAYFNNIPGESDVYFKVYKDEYFKKINNFYKVPKIDRDSKRDTLLNIVALKKFNYSDNTAVTADTLNAYNTRYGAMHSLKDTESAEYYPNYGAAHGVNTEFVLGHLRVYIDADQPNRQSIIDHLNEFAELLGFPGAFIITDVPTSNSIEVYNNYNPYPYNRNVYQGQIGCNLYWDGSYMSFGGSRILNGYRCNYQGDVHANNYNTLDHEMGHFLGFNHIGGGFNWSTMDPVGAITGVTASESKYDSAIMPVWLKLGKLHYDSLDSEGRLLDYGMTMNIENYDGIWAALDDDNDGVINNYDACEETDNTFEVDDCGCAEYQLDDDLDGVVNSLDLCPNSTRLFDVDENGCDPSDYDDDNDGITNDKDLCPNSIDGIQVNDNGCSLIQLGDDDGDGVKNENDLCPNSEPLTGVTVAGGNGIGSEANQLYYPSDVFVDEEHNIYVLDSWNNRVQKFTNGNMNGITVAGGNGEGSANNQFNKPSSLFVDSEGNIYVSDYLNHRVMKWLPNASEGVLVAGGNGSGMGANQLKFPCGIYVNNEGSIYIADRDNGRIQKWNLGATEGVSVAGSINSNILQRPKDVFVDNNGNIYLTNYKGNNVGNYNPGNPTVEKWQEGGSTGEVIIGINENALNGPSSIQIKDGNIFVLELEENIVTKWFPDSLDGIIVAGGETICLPENSLNFLPRDSSNITYYNDDFYLFSNIHLGPNGELYVVDTGNHRIQEWASVNNEGCASDTSLSDITIEAKSSITLFPNPTKDLLYIKGDISQLKSIDIYNIVGQHIIRIKENFNEIKISSLPAAMYFVKLSTNATNITYKVIKE